MTTPTPHGAPELPLHIAEVTVSADDLDMGFSEAFIAGQIRLPNGTHKLYTDAVVRAAIQQAAGAVPDVPFAWYSAKVDDVITDAKKQGRLLVQPWDAKHYDKPLYAASPAPPDAVPQDNREAFESHLTRDVSGLGTFLEATAKHDNGDYISRFSQQHWLTWQAAKQQPDSVHLAGGECGGVQTPLTDEQINLVLARTLDALAKHYKMDHAIHIRTDIAEHTKLRIDFARAIEAAHGIGNAPRPSAPTGQINPDSAAQGKEADHG